MLKGVMQNLRWLITMSTQLNTDGIFRFDLTNLLNCNDL
jgi:hypothetical protein